jgi:mannose-6-phosphate isomerase-like protein (cupin superfamily)
MVVPMNEPEQKTVPKPWGHELIWAITDRYVGKILHIKAGHSLSLQYHVKKEETVMVLTGKMAFTYYREGEAPTVIELGPLQPFHVTPELRHRMTAIVDTQVVEVSTTELDDVVRLEDKYGREGTSQP